jgi:hypothetical protein
MKNPVLADIVPLWRFEVKKFPSSFVRFQIGVFL